MSQRNKMGCEMRKFNCYKTWLSILTIVLFLVLLLSGCAGFTSPARKHVLESNTPYWFDYDASRRGAFLLSDNNTKVKICAEPSPDVALQIINKFMLTVPLEKIPVQGQVNISQQVLQLAGRTQTILFLRESLYRLCELSVSNNFTKDDIKALYENVIEVSSKLAEAELTKAQTEYRKETNRLFELRRELFNKVDVIIDCVKKDRKVDKEKLENLIKGTGLEKSFKKFYEKPIEEFKEALESRYIDYIDILLDKCKNTQPTGGGVK